MKSPTLVLSLACALSACQAPQSAQQRQAETLRAMAFSRELLQAPSCAGPARHASAPGGYSKDAAGYRPEVTAVGRSAGPIPQRSGAVLVPYHLAAQPDPQNPRLYHAAHTVWRLEHDAAWQTSGYRELPSAPLERPASTPGNSRPGDGDELNRLKARMAEIENAQRVNAGDVRHNEGALATELQALQVKVQRLEAIQGVPGPSPLEPTPQNQ
jgi:hypothetical protein